MGCPGQTTNPATFWSRSGKLSRRLGDCSEIFSSSAGDSPMDHHTYSIGLQRLTCGFLGGGNRSKAKKEMGEKDGKAWHSDHSDPCLISRMAAFASEGPSQIFPRS